MTGTARTTIELVPAGIRAGTAHLAFPIYERIPRGCVTWPVVGDRHAPHHQLREQALVDTADREIVWGEVYLVNQGINAVLREVCNENEKQRQQRDRPERPCAWLRPLNRLRSWEEVQRIINETGPREGMPAAQERRADPPGRPARTHRRARHRAVPASGVWEWLGARRPCIGSRLGVYPVAG